MSVNVTEIVGRSGGRVAKAAFGIAVLGNLLFSGASAVGAATLRAPAGGAVKIFATVSGNGLSGPILFVGAIGDYGKYLTVDQNGKADVNGNFVKITLKKGAFEVNSTTLNAAANKMQPAVNATTCSGSISVTDPVTLLDGVGMYKGIAGTVNITETFAFVLPTFTSGAKKGQCNESNNSQPIAQYGSITGAGTVTFG